MKLTCGSGSTYYCPYCNHTISRPQDPLFSRRREQYDPRSDMERRQQLAYYASQREIQFRNKRRRYELSPETALLPRKAQEFAVPISKPKSLPRVQQSYQFSATKHSQVPFSQKPQEFIAPQSKPPPRVYDSHPITVKTFLSPTSNLTPTQKRDNFIAPSEQQRVNKSAPVRIIERRSSAETKKTGVEQLADTAKKLQQQSEASVYLKFNRPTFQEPPKKPVSINTENRLMNQSATNARSQSSTIDKRMLQKTASEERPVVTYTKPGSNQDSGLLTDSLSCIFTRRQHIVPQKRVFYEDVPQEDVENKDDQLSDTESTYLTSKQLESPEKQCPEPPVISQPTPNITNEDWFATKQRILSSVNHAPPKTTTCEPQVGQQKDKCPEPPHISVDPHGFDIEPPDHIKNNVSPYIPSSSFERDEYNKYKCQQLKKEAALRQQAKQTAEAVKMVQQLASYFKENEQKINEANALKEKTQQQMMSPYEPQTSTSQDNFHHSITYNPTQISKADSSENQTENVQDYEYQQGSYEAASYEEQNRHYDEAQNRHYDEAQNRHYDEAQNRHYDETQNRHYDEAPPANQLNSFYYKDQNDYNRASYIEPMISQSTHEEPTNLENVCPEAPNISETTQMTKDETHGQPNAPEAPYISQDTAQSYFQTQNYEKTNKVGEQQVGAEPFNSASAKMCHKCSFQTTNVKKLKDHLKFVHGETNVDFGAPPKGNDLFSRREPKQDELFSRRDVPQQEEEQKKIQIKFKRRNTAALVNILSSEVVVPAKESDEGNEGNVGYDSGNVQDQGQTSSVLEALEYFETTKDQPKKPRPYQRNPEENMDHDWI